MARNVECPLCGEMADLVGTSTDGVRQRKENLTADAICIVPTTKDGKPALTIAYHDTYPVPVPEPEGGTAASGGDGGTSDGSDSSDGGDGSPEETTPESGGEEEPPEVVDTEADAEVLDPDDLSDLQHLVFEHIRTKGASSTASIAGALDTAPQAIVTAVEKLTEKGFIRETEEGFETAGWD